MRLLASACLVALVVSALAVSALPQQPENPIVAVLSAPSLGGSCTMLPEPMQSEMEAFMRSIEFHELNKNLMASSKNGGGAATPPTAPPTNSPTGGCVWNIYVDWLQSMGFRVLPLRWDATKEETLETIRHVNAILFPGGILSRSTSLYATYFNRMCDIYDYVVSENQLGNPLALWGTCEGFQMIGACAAGRNTSIMYAPYHGTSPAMMANNWTQYTMSSKMYGSAPEHILHQMHDENTTLNWHHIGIPPSEFVQNPILNASGMVPLSTTLDVDGHPFVSSYEMSGTGMNIFAVQFHPERVMFSFESDIITHQVKAIEVSEYLGLFLVTRARMNNNTFPSFKDIPKLINNYPVTNVHKGIRIYYL